MSVWTMVCPTWASSPIKRGRGKRKGDATQLGINNIEIAEKRHEWRREGGIIH